MSFYKSRRQLKDPGKLGRMYMLYNSFYEKAAERHRHFVDAGYEDCFSMDWLVK